MGTHSAATRKRKTAGLSRALQQRGHALSCDQERDNRELIRDACQFGSYETADEVSRLDSGIYEERNWTKQ